MKPLYFLLAAMFACLGFSRMREPVKQSKTVVSKNLSVEVVDLTRKFLMFYDTAMQKNLDTGARWLLWKRLYGFAAVPPGPDGQKMARKLLDSAWSRYPGVINRIRQGPSVLDPSPQHILDKVARVLKPDTTQYAVKVKLLVFVGGLEDNAFAYTSNGISTVAIPIEINNHQLALTMAHEFTHAVHTKMAKLSGAYVKSIAELVMMEGIAMRVTEQLWPGETPETYTNAHSDTWLKDAASHQKDILKGVQQHLADSSYAAMTQFTFGTGTTGLQRESYYAGWIIVGQLEKQGFTLSKLACLPSASIKTILNETIEAMLKN
jgi:hypothetical protein